MRINNVGFNFEHPKEFSVFRPKGSGDYLVIFILTPAIFIMQGQELLAEKNTLIIYKEGTPQYYKAKSQNFINHWFHFTLEEETDVFGDLEIPLDTLINDLDADFISNSIYGLSCEVNGNKIHGQRIAELQVKLFFLKLSQIIQEKNNSTAYHKYYHDFNRIRQEIYNEPYQHFQVIKLAQRLDISLSHFQHTYKDIFGVSCMVDITQSKINYAKYNLVKNDYKVSIIAELCGYENEVHFMRLFKRHEGITPSAYRRFHQEHQ